MLGRIKQTDLSVPYKMGEYWYFNKTEEGKQYPTYLRSKTKDGKDAEVLLDQNEMAKGFKYFCHRRFRAERRRQYARVFDRHDRLPTIHASVQRSANGQDACRTRSSA